MNIRRASAGTLWAHVLLWAWVAGACAAEIHDAVKDNDVEKVKAMLKENRLLIHEKDNYGETPLHKAAFYGRLEIAKVLIANKADVNAQDKAGDALYSMDAKPGGSQVLLEEATSPANGARRPLRRCCQDRGTCRVLSRGECACKEKYGRTPLHRAAPKTPGVVRCCSRRRHASMRGMAAEKRRCTRRREACLEMHGRPWNC